MAVTQISKIQIRRGLQENLPQLSSAEMGWSVDEQRLFIGNGTLSEGAPFTGVTEILTTQSIYSELALIESLEGNVANMTANITSIQSNVASLQANAALNTFTLTDNTTNGNIVISTSPSLLDYTITRGADVRLGIIKGTYINGVALLEDDYVESADIGVTFGFTGNMFQYTTTSTGDDATFAYYAKRFV
jgi:hypothetical protein